MLDLTIGDLLIATGLAIGGSIVLCAIYVGGAAGLERLRRMFRG
jgi:hypothetical protein